MKVAAGNSDWGNAGRSETRFRCGRFLAAWALCFIFLRLAAALSETGPESVTADRSRLQERIEQKKTEFEQIRAEEGSVLEVLGRIDAKLLERNRELERLNEALRRQETDVERTQGQQRTVLESLGRRKEVLASRARALYRWQRGGSPFVLLSGEFSVPQLMRRKRYLEIVLAHDLDLIDGLVREQAELEAVATELQAKRERLRQKRNASVALRASIRSEREEKNKVLYSLRREKRLRARALEELEAAAKKLEEMVTATPVREPVRKETSWPGFAKAQGTLDLPVAGRIIGGFGTRKHPVFNVEVNRRGIDIAAPLGEAIHAVERGTVIFAERFAGYGQMIIIDHGGRYYTVYAHLSELSKTVGDRVRRGEMIATVGDSESFGAPRLYFEIRKDGKPVDPAPWFRPTGNGKGPQAEQKKASLQARRETP